MYYKFFLLFIPILLLGGLIFSVINPLLFGVASNSENIPAQADRMESDVRFLTELQPARNYLNLVSLNKAADYVFDEFSKLNCKVERQKFDAKGSEYQNVIAHFGPEDAQRIVIGGHYDVCGDQPGADDNASAVAGLLELARLFDELKPELKYHYEFVAYTLEEPPFFRTDKMGSAVHAQSLKDANINVELMLSLEMIGYFSEEEGSQDYPIGLLKWFYPTKGNFIAVIGKMGQGGVVRKMKRMMKAACGIPVKSINAPVALQGIDFSDHRNYWKQGYSAFMICDTAFMRNKNYHEKSDTIDTLDFEKMSEVVKGVYWAVVKW